MDKKIVTPCRIFLIISAVCLLAIFMGWKYSAGDIRKFDCFFEPSENILLHIDSDGNSADEVLDVSNTITTITALSEIKPTVISSCSFVANRSAMRYILNARLSMDLYQYHPDKPSVLEPLAKGVNAVFYEERLLNSGLNGLMITASFSDFENKTVPEGLRTIKPGYRLAVKFDPELFPGFFYIASQEKGPMCLIRGEVK